jgi:hypothetical protein
MLQLIKIAGQKGISVTKIISVTNRFYVTLLLGLSSKRLTCWYASITIPVFEKILVYLVLHISANDVKR